MAVCVLALAACRHVPPAPPPAPAVVTRPCLVGPPPPHARFAPADCPAGFVGVCYAEADSRAAMDELDARRRWDATAWAGCAVDGAAPGR